MEEESAAGRKSTGAKGIESSEREVMMAPNNIDFFYAAEETSERIWRIDERLNMMYRWLVRVALTAGVTAFALHIKHMKDMREAAFHVSTKIEKEGARVEIDKEGAVVIKMDGKIQTILPSENSIRVDNPKSAETTLDSTTNASERPTQASVNIPLM